MNARIDYALIVDDLNAMSACVDRYNFDNDLKEQFSQLKQNIASVFKADFNGDKIARLQYIDEQLVKIINTEDNKKEYPDLVSIVEDLKDKLDAIKLNFQLEKNLQRKAELEEAKKAAHDPVVAEPPKSSVNEGNEDSQSLDSLLAALTAPSELNPAPVDPNQLKGNISTARDNLFAYATGHEKDNTRNATLKTRYDLAKEVAGYMNVLSWDLSSMSRQSLMASLQSAPLFMDIVTAMRNEEKEPLKRLNPAELKALESKIYTAISNRLNEILNNKNDYRAVHQHINHNKNNASPNEPPRILALIQQAQSATQAMMDHKFPQSNTPALDQLEKEERRGRRNEQEMIRIKQIEAKIAAHPLEREREAQRAQMPQQKDPVAKSDHVKEYVELQTNKYAPLIGLSETFGKLAAPNSPLFPITDDMAKRVSAIVVSLMSPENLNKSSDQLNKSFAELSAVVNNHLNNLSLTNTRALNPVDLATFHNVTRALVNLNELIKVEATKSIENTPPRPPSMAIENPPRPPSMVIANPPLQEDKASAERVAAAKNDSAPNQNQSKKTSNNIAIKSLLKSISVSSLLTRFGITKPKTNGSQKQNANAEEQHKPSKK